MATLNLPLMLNFAYLFLIIPHTIDNITVGMKKTGDYVNIETDLFGKYVEKILKFNDFNNIEKKEKKSNLTMEFLQKNGF